MSRILVPSAVLFCCLADICSATSLYINSIVSVRVGIENQQNENVPQPPLPFSPAGVAAGLRKYEGMVPITVKCVSRIRQLTVRSINSKGIPVIYRYKPNGKSEITVLVKMEQRDKPIHIDVGDAIKFRSFVAPQASIAEGIIYLIPVQEESDQK